MEGRNNKQVSKSAQKLHGESKTLMTHLVNGELDPLRRAFDRMDLQKKQAIINGLYLVPIVDFTSGARTLHPMRFLYVAFRGLQWDIAEFLLENGANPNDDNFPNEGPPVNSLLRFLEKLYLSWSKNEEIISIDQMNKLLHLLLDKGADFSRNHPDMSLMSLLAVGVDVIKLDFFLKLIKKMGREAFQASLEVPIFEADGRKSPTTVLNIVCMGHQPAHLELFLRNGANPHACTPDGRTPLTICMKALRDINKSLASCVIPAEAAKLKKNADNVRMMIDILIAILVIARNCVLPRSHLSA